MKILTKLTSPYKVKWYTLSLNDGWISGKRNFLFKQYSVDRVATLLRFKWGFGENRRTWYLSLDALHHGELDEEMVNTLRCYFDIEKQDLYADGAWTYFAYVYDFQNPIWGKPFKKLLVGDLRDAIFYINKGFSKFQNDGLIRDRGNVVNVAYRERDKSWYGWSHRAMGKFGLGYIIDNPDSILLGNPFTPDCDMFVEWESLMKKYDIKLGYVADTDDKCLLLAKIFAQQVS